MTQQTLHRLIMEEEEEAVALWKEGRTLQRRRYRVIIRAIIASATRPKSSATGSSAPTSRADAK